jgi:vacuolar-type H+-ATPase subunit E/Vma4
MAIVEQSMTGLAAKRTARLRMIEAEIRAETDAALALERRRVRNEVLSARHAMLERVFTAVTAAIPGALLGEGSSNLVRHLDEALVYMPDGGARVRCRVELEAIVRPLAACHDLPVELAPDGRWGIVLVDPTGHIEIDNTLEARLEGLRAVLAVELVQHVEGAGDGRLG